MITSIIVEVFDIFVAQEDGFDQVGSDLREYDIYINMYRIADVYCYDHTSLVDFLF